MALPYSFPIHSLPLFPPLILFIEAIVKAKGSPTRRNPRDASYVKLPASPSKEHCRGRLDMLLSSWWKKLPSPEFRYRGWKSPSHPRLSILHLLGYTTCRNVCYGTQVTKKVRISCQCWKKRKRDFRFQKLKIHCTEEKNKICGHTRPIFLHCCSWLGPPPTGSGYKNEVLFFVGPIVHHSLHLSLLSLQHQDRGHFWLLLNLHYLIYSVRGRGLPTAFSYKSACGGSEVEKGMT